MGNEECFIHDFVPVLSAGYGKVYVKMEFSKEKLRQIKRLMVLAAFLILMILYSDKVLVGVFFVVNILKPFLYGGAIAFALNIPMKALEEKLLAGWKGKADRKSVV